MTTTPDNSATPAPVRHLTSSDPLRWYQAGDRPIFLADALDETNSPHMSVGFAHYAAGSSNEWTVTYDEALVITSGVFTVEWAEGATTAGAGEVIVLTAGTALIYRAEEDTELVYVTYPHWFAATAASPHAKALEFFQPVERVAR